MIIGDQLRALREQQNLSQGDIEKRTGLLRCYVSRVENGHAIPSIETLEKWARALNVPLYQAFYESKDSPAPEPIKTEKSNLFGFIWRGSWREVQMRREIDEQEFLEFARSYLSEASPSPQRIGCPSDWELIRMSEHPKEELHAAISDHLTFCSPCFRRYMEILGELKHRIREQS